MSTTYTAHASIAELQTILDKNLPIDALELLGLAMLAAEQGRNTLAFDAVEYALSIGPLQLIATPALSILARIERYDRIDKFFQDFQRARGRLHPQVLSSWAQFLITTDISKAIDLSDKALSLAPHDPFVVENYLIVGPQKKAFNIKRFMSKHYLDLVTDIGFFNAANAFMKVGDYESAEEYFRISLLILEDSAARTYTAECLYRQGRYSEALCEIVQAEQSIPVSIGEISVGIGGTRENFSPKHGDKKRLQKMIWAIKGKCLCALGETESGLRFVRDSIDITLPYKCVDTTLDGIDDLAGDYEDRSQIQENQIALQQQLSMVFSRVKQRETVITNFQNIVESIAAVHQEWGDALQALQSSALDTEQVDQSFQARIHAFVAATRIGGVERYSSIRKSVEKSLKYLPPMSLELLANAEFLALRLEGVELPVWAAVVLERSKALETTINEVLISPFVSDFVVGPITYKVRWTDRNGRDNTITVKERGFPKRLMLGAVGQFLRCDDRSWSEYVNKKLYPWRDWVTRELPVIVDTCKDTFRNACAHSSSATRKTADDLHKYLADVKAFETLNSIAKKII